MPVIEYKGPVLTLHQKIRQADGPSQSHLSRNYTHCALDDDSSGLENNVAFVEIHKTCSFLRPLPNALLEALGVENGLRGCVLRRGCARLLHTRKLCYESVEYTPREFVLVQARESGDDVRFIALRRR